MNDCAKIQNFFDSANISIQNQRKAAPVKRSLPYDGITVRHFDCKDMQIMREKKGKGQMSEKCRIF